MQIDNFLTNVSVIGSSGKMGRGIALLLLQEMSRTELSLTGGLGNYRLNLIDSNFQAFHDLKRYLRDQITKYAEKNINVLRQYYSKNLKLINNKEMIEEFVKGAFDCVYFSDSIENASKSHLIFEAISEDVQQKANLFSALNQKLDHKAYFFTNTSSIPIHALEHLSGIEGRIVGFHFYNPPIVQKLIELIIPKNCDPELKAIAEQLVTRLGKKAIYSNDIAGFIGNGHFSQEMIFACQMAKKTSIYLVDIVTKDFLLRPMGIFQLMDYVGIDVCSKLLKVMQGYLPEKILHDDLIDQMILANKLGGQTLNGDQKPGFFEYEGLIPKAVYSLKDQRYIPLETLSKSEHALLGEHPDPSLTWKNLQHDVLRDEKLKKYFEKLKSGKNLGSDLAIQFLENSRNIGNQLVLDGVAENLADVTQVLKNGFFHLYGVNDFKGDEK